MRIAKAAVLKDPEAGQAGNDGAGHIDYPRQAPGRDLLDLGSALAFLAIPTAVALSAA